MFTATARVKPHFPHPRKMGKWALALLTPPKQGEQAQRPLLRQRE